MTVAEDTLFRRHYDRSQRAKLAPRGSYRMIDYLRNRLVDRSLDIRTLKVDGKPTQCIVRWVHPRLALGKMAEGVFGMDKIPVVALKGLRDDGTPREVTYRDCDKLILFTREVTRMQQEAAEKQWEQDEKDAKRPEEDFKAEVLLNANPKFYYSIANENRRRILSGEVQGYGNSGEGE
jgi:hypothetical protein